MYNNKIKHKILPKLYCGWLSISEIVIKNFTYKLLIFIYFVQFHEGALLFANFIDKH